MFSNGKSAFIQISFALLVKVSFLFCCFNDFFSLVIWFSVFWLSCILWTSCDSPTFCNLSVHVSCQIWEVFIIISLWTFSALFFSPFPVDFHWHKKGRVYGSSLLLGSAGDSVSPYDLCYHRWWVSLPLSRVKSPSSLLRLMLSLRDWVGVSWGTLLWPDEGGSPGSPFNLRWNGFGWGHSVFLWWLAAVERLFSKNFLSW